MKRTNKILNVQFVVKGFFPDEPSVLVSNKELNTLVQFAELCSNLALKDHFTCKCEQSIPVLVHKNCCCDFTDKKRLVQTEGPRLIPKMVKRSDINTLDWKNDCFLCGKTIKDEKKHPGIGDSRMVETLPFRKNLIITCQKTNDEWGTQVELRMRLY